MRINKNYLLIVGIFFFLFSCIDKGEDTIILPAITKGAFREVTCFDPNLSSGYSILSNTVKFEEDSILVTTNQVKIILSDFAAQDGDVASLYLSDTSSNCSAIGFTTKVADEINLANNRHEVIATLPNKGYNYLVMIADEDAVGPSTLEIIINGKKSQFALRDGEGVGFIIYVAN